MGGNTNKATFYETTPQGAERNKGQNIYYVAQIITLRTRTLLQVLPFRFEAIRAQHEILQNIQIYPFQPLRQYFAEDLL